MSTSKESSARSKFDNCNRISTAWKAFAKCAEQESATDPRWSRKHLNEKAAPGESLGQFFVIFRTVRLISLMFRLGFTCDMTFPKASGEVWKAQHARQASCGGWLYQVTNVSGVINAS